MLDAIEILENEHRLIERVLASLEGFVEHMNPANANERERVRQYTTLFQDLVDICHHGKEEDYLFPKMNAHGFSKEFGPISAMLSEQGEGREHLNALKVVCAGSGPLTHEECEVVRGHALAYVLRLRPHIKREDMILFPMVRKTLPTSALNELTAEFEQFERKKISPQIRQEIETTAGELLAAFPPDPARLADNSLIGPI